MTKKRKPGKLKKDDLSNRLKWYFNNRWTKSYKKIYIIPSISWNWSAYGDFIEQGVYAPMFIVKFEWLHFEAGFYNYHELN